MHIIQCTLWWLAICLVQARTATPTVNLSLATVVGSNSDRVDSFKGIPYAEPPQRLATPVPIATHLGIVHATGTPRSCPQFNFDTSSFPQNILGYVLDTPLFQEITNAGEDCLTIDVQRPEGSSPTSKLPVLFWIYGGGYSSGSSSSYDGAAIVNKSVSRGQPTIYVTFNYRVGGFGFLPGKEVKEAGLTNLGYRDQILAMRWLADNIEQFGGDPSKVTIWGESAGSTSVFDHLVLYGGNNTYKGQPLFRAGIMNSGSLQPTLPVDSNKAQDIFDTVVETAGCSVAVDPIDCLRAMPYQNFLNAANSVPSLISYESPDLSYRPRQDGDLIPDSQELLLQSSRYAKVPLIIGDQQDEGTLSATFTNNVTSEADMVQYLTSVLYTSTSEQQLNDYVQSYPLNASAGVPENTGYQNQLYPSYKRNAAVFTDATIRFTRRLALEIIGSSVPTWSYVATYGHGTPFVGTSHGSDIAHSFGQTPGFPSDSIQAYYISFVNTLDPNPSQNDKAKWPKYHDNKQLLNFGESVNTLASDDFRSESFALFSSNLTALRV